MPYLQLDVNGTFSASAKKNLARRMSESYARMMQVDIRRISVAIRECGEEGIWRVVDAPGGEPVPVSVLMLDIRRGRPSEQRMELARHLIALCVEELGLSEDRLNVEFTQHSGDEMYHPTLGGFSPEWSEGES
jgi:phenylpyruvate tautomerase PptA (4-oxalocrotonate tautomerase family)